MYVYTKCYLQQNEVAQLQKIFFLNLSTYHTLNLAYWSLAICYLKMLFSTIFMAKNGILGKSRQNGQIFKKKDQFSLNQNNISKNQGCGRLHTM